VVFRRLMHAFGAGGPSVHTVLEQNECRPGGVLRGEVHLRGGDRPAAVERVELGLVTSVEFEGGDHEQAGGVEFARLPLAERFELPAGAAQTLPFGIPVPWEAPLTAVFGQPLRGMAVGVRTQVAVARAVDAGHLGAVALAPLPAQELFLDAVARLGFGLRGAEVEYGQLPGVPQQMPFYQEISFYPAPLYAGRLDQLELTFVAGADGLEVVFKVDTGNDQDTVHHLRVEHATAGQTDWAAYLDHWLRHLLFEARDDDRYAS
jgi:sporulation-control protein